MDYVICHYNEIGLKGKNRRFFEEQLVKNIKQVMLPGSFKLIKRISGRILVELTKAGAKNHNKISKSLKNVFGIAYFAFAINSKQDIKSIQVAAYKTLKDAAGKTFRISAKRSTKDFPLTSQQINEKVGAEICKKLKSKVNLKNPSITCFIEIVEKYAFLYTKKIKGPGGLPVGVSGKAILLLSGGIDSPVAGFHIMKRGVRLIFVHFHAHPYTNKASLEKIYQLTKLLNKFQCGTSDVLHKNLYLVPFGEIQKEILLKTPEKFRVILYRRMMMKISEEIANKERALALITGESIGQVASQTLENLRVIEESVELPVMRPLIGQDKEEIIKKAKEIKTFEISILPHQDCCARFLPKHPATKAKLDDVKQAEKKLNIKKLIKDAIQKTGS